MIGVIFDFNGTLFEDQDKQVASWNAFAESVIGRSLRTDEFAEHVFGQNTGDTLGYIFGRELLPTEVERYGEEKESLYRSLCLQDKAHFRLREGAEDFFEGLVKYNVPRTIATASGKQNVDFFFRELKLGRWFDRAKVVYNDGMLRSKPDPQVFVIAMQRLNIPPEQSLIIEDSSSGIEAALRAEAQYVVAIASDKSKAKMLEQFPELSAVISGFRNSNKLVNAQWLASH